MQEQFNTKSSVTMTVNDDGDKFWRNLAGQCHRTDGPAVEYADGTREWWLRGKRHRPDGPAVEHADGDKEWWLNNQRVSAEEFAVLQGARSPISVRPALKFKSASVQ